MKTNSMLTGVLAIIVGILILSGWAATNGRRGHISDCFRHCNADKKIMRR